MKRYPKNRLFESDAQRLKDEVKMNLKLSLDKLKSMVYMSNIELFANPKIEVIDWELHTGEGLEMILIEISFSTYLESPMLSDLTKDLIKIEKSLNETLDRIKFDNMGNLKSAKESSKGLINGGIMLDELEFDSREETMDISVGCMFTLGS